MEEYRAKITKIYPFVEEIYNTTDGKIVRDASDIYILLDNASEAEVLEKLNACEEQSQKIKETLYEIIDENCRRWLGD